MTTADDGRQAEAGAGDAAPRSVSVDGDLTGAQIGIGTTVVQIRADGMATVLYLDGQETVRTQRRPLPRIVEVPPGFAALGRERELARLADAVAAGETAQVYGPPGIGKTTLLLHATARGALDTGGLDGVLFLHLRGLPVEEATQEILTGAYDLGFLRLPGQAERRALLSGLRALVVLDDLDCSADDLTRLTRELPHCVVVVASARRTLTVPGSTFGLRGLPLAAALTLFGDALRRSLTDDEAARAEQAWRLSEGHPGRLALVAAYLREAAEHGIPPEVPPAEGLPLLVPKLIDWLSPAAAGLLRSLVWAGTAEWGQDLAESLPGGSPGAVAELVAAGLLLCDQDRLRPAEGVTAALLPADVAGPAEEDRTGSGAADPGTAPGPAAGPGGSELAAVATAVADWLERVSASRGAREAEAVTALSRQAADAGLDAVAIRLARAGAPRMMLGLRLHAWGRLLDTGLGAARRSRRAEDEAYFTHESGIRALCLNDLVKAGALLAAAAGLGVESGRVVGELLNAPGTPPPPPAPPGAPAAPGPVPARAAAGRHGLLGGKALLAAAVLVAASAATVSALTVGGHHHTAAPSTPPTTTTLPTHSLTPATSAPAPTGSVRPTASATPTSPVTTDTGATTPGRPETTDSESFYRRPRNPPTVYADGFGYRVLVMATTHAADGSPQLQVEAGVWNDVPYPATRRLKSVPLLKAGEHTVEGIPDAVSFGSTARKTLFTFPLYPGFSAQDARLEFPGYSDGSAVLPLAPGATVVAQAPGTLSVSGTLHNAMLDLTVLDGLYRTDVVPSDPYDVAPKLNAGNAGILITYDAKTTPAADGTVGLRPGDFELVLPDGRTVPFTDGTDFGGFTAGRDPGQQWIEVQVPRHTGTYTLRLTYATQTGTSGGPEDSLTFTVRN